MNVESIGVVGSGGDRAWVRFVAVRCPVFDTWAHAVGVVAKPFVIES